MVDYLVDVDEAYEVFSPQFGILWHIHGAYLGCSACYWGAPFRNGVLLTNYRLVQWMILNIYLRLMTIIQFTRAGNCHT